MSKLDQKQLLETVRETIYEVLEEELDNRLKNAKKKKTQKINEQKEATLRAGLLKRKLQEQKKKLKQAYTKLTEKEKKLNEKWGKDAEVEKTGEWKNFSVAELKKKLNTLKKKENKTEADKKKEHQIMFAIRSKGGWKKGEGATD